MADIRAELRSKTKVHASIRQATGAAGTKQHSQLSGRDVPDQHPMTAITGLVSALAKKSDGMEITVEGLVYLTSGGERIAGPYKLFSTGDGEHSGPAYVASDEPPEDTDALWIDTTPPEEAVALGVTAVETAEGVDLHCTDELGTTKVTVLNGRDGAQGPRGEAGPAGPAGPQGAPGDDYVLTDEDKREIAGIAAGMVPGANEFRLVNTVDIAASEESFCITLTESDDGVPYFEEEFVVEIESFTLHWSYFVPTISDGNTSQNLSYLNGIKQRILHIHKLGMRYVGVGYQDNSVHPGYPFDYQKLPVDIPVIRSLTIGPFKQFTGRVYARRKAGGSNA